MSPVRAAAGRGASAAVLLALASVAALLKARSYDLWWHLETGEQIVRTRAIPRVDDFSFTSAGTPWVDHAWLFQILLYVAHLAGPVGFTLLKGLCVAGVAAAGFTWLTRRGASVSLALSVTAIAVVGLRPRIGERPETMTLLMAALAAWLLLDLAGRPARPAARLTLVALLTILWVNLHGGALLCPVIALAVAVGATISAGPRGALSSWVCVPLTAVCALVNPYGPRIFLVPSSIAAALAPANLDNPEWARPALADFPLFYATAGVALILMAIDLFKRRPLAPARTALFLVAAGMGVTSIRHTGIFFALLPMMIEPGERGWLSSSSGRALTAGVVVGALLFMTLYPPAGARPGIGIDPDRYPQKAVDFIDSHLPDARLYNDVQAGGYLIWRGYPGRRVFIDGRNEVHASLLKELSASLDDGRLWQSLLDRHGVEGAIVGYRTGLVQVAEAGTGRTTRSTFSELHFPAATWALVYWDDQAMVFVRRSGRFAGMAGSLQYRYARPEAWAAGLPDQVDPDAGEGLVEEINRRLKDDPECHLAREAAARYHAGSPFPSQ